MKRFTAVAVLACLILIIGQQSIRAADRRKSTRERLEELEESVTALQQKVGDLEQRVQQLETTAEEEAEAEESGPPKYTLQDSWGKLQKGLSQDQVRSILGEPGQKSQDGHTWFYMVRHKLYGVTFDESGALTEWKNPFK